THDSVRDQIKAIALNQITELGSAALSLGAIARAMGLTTPALYRYYPGRAELITALIADAYTSLTQALADSQGGISTDNYTVRFRAVSLAYFEWAKAHPQQYLLMFGSPIPNHEIEAEAGQAADRSFLLILDLIDSADKAGKLTFPFEPASLPINLKVQLETIHHPGTLYSPKVTYLSLVSWSFLHGMTSLDIYQRYALILGKATEDFLQVEVDRLIHSIGLV
ncbi:MAG TPA: TetR/AcrR family transcriptional regulator, partial [Longilinea sp.]|nr:TetR/AcrR family transcriptional regulator [Longilinea sp.]